MKSHVNENVISQYAKKKETHIDILKLKKKSILLMTMYWFVSITFAETFYSMVLRKN